MLWGELLKTGKKDEIKMSLPGIVLRVSRTEKTRKQVAKVHSSNTVRPSQERNSFSWKNIYEKWVVGETFSSSLLGGVCRG